MAAVASGTVPELTADPAASRFAHRWARSLVEGGRAAASIAELAGELEPLVKRIATTISDGTPDDALGPDVGATLLARNWGASDPVNATLVTLLTDFAHDFGPELAVPPGPGPDLLRERLINLAGAIASGFADAMRTTVIAQQEEMQRAALRAVRESEREQRASEARFRALFDQTAVGIGMVDTTGHVIDANAAWAAMMGFRSARCGGAT